MDHAGDSDELLSLSTHSSRSRPRCPAAGYSDTIAYSHIQFFELAGQGIAPPTEQAGGLLLVAVGML